LRDLPHVGDLRVGHFFRAVRPRAGDGQPLRHLPRTVTADDTNPARNLGVMARLLRVRRRPGDRRRRAVQARRVTPSATPAVGPTASHSTSRGTGVARLRERRRTPRPFRPGVQRAAAAGSTTPLPRPTGLRIGAATPNRLFAADTGDLKSPCTSSSVSSSWRSAVGGASGSTRWCLRRTPAPRCSAADAETTFPPTGRHRDRKDGTVDRLIPLRDFVSGTKGDIGNGPGAVELACAGVAPRPHRRAVRGGDVWDVNIGLNWYLNPYLRRRPTTSTRGPKRPPGEPATATASACDWATSSDPAGRRRSRHPPRRHLQNGERRDVSPPVLNHTGGLRLAVRPV
jgi:hypothetical protein